jgi:hypothetical protein
VKKYEISDKVTHIVSALKMWKSDDKQAPVNNGLKITTSLHYLGVANQEDKYR